FYKNPKLNESESGAQSGRQVQQQSRLVVVSGRTQRIVANVLDKGFGGDRKVDDEFCTLLDNAFKEKSRTNDLNRVDDDLWRGFAVFTTTTDGNRFQQISRHITKQSAQNKPSIWFMFTGLHENLSHYICALMTIPAFKASVEMSAQIVHSMGVDAIECLTETMFWETDLNGQNIHRVFIAAAVHHMAFVDVMRAVGVTPDGYLGASLGELMCLYLDGLCDRRQCLAMCQAVRLPDNPRPLWTFRGVNSWHEIERHCANGTDICVAAHYADSHFNVVGTEVAVYELRDALHARQIQVSEVRKKYNPLHTGNLFVPNMGQVLLDQFTQVVPERTHSKPSDRLIFTSRPTLRLVGTADNTIGFSAAESFANTLLSTDFFKEAVDRLPADALVVNIDSNSGLRDVALSGRPQELYVRQSESSPEPVFGINHLFREIGLVFTAGHWPRVHDLMANI
ncbi:unnamed protein product, partial [Medioppia subpectinata]